MIRKIVPFKPWHMDWLEARSPIGVTFSSEVRAQLEGQHSRTAVLDGEVVLAAGP